jgi:hypothetical protein
VIYISAVAIGSTGMVMVARMIRDFGVRSYSYDVVTKVTHIITGKWASSTMTSQRDEVFSHKPKLSN